MLNTARFTRPFRRSDIDVVHSRKPIEPTIFTHRLDTKKISAVRAHEEVAIDDDGNEIITHVRVGQTTPSIPLSIMLLTKWQTDVHFSMYHTSEQRRMQKSNPTCPPLNIEFKLCAFDLDFDAHRTKPTDADFDHLILCLQIIDHMPNIVYQTRGGARIIYIIDPIRDANTFEGHYQRMLTKLKEPFENAHMGYAVDETKDWTRLFRAPLVVRDGRAEYDYHIRTFHTDTIDIRRFKVMPKEERVWGNGNQKFRPNDAYLHARMKEIEPGNRNNALFRAACHALRIYLPDAAETWLDELRNKAHAEGLAPVEIEAVIRSAENATRKGQK